MLAPGMPRRTPGIDRVRLTKLRPLSGSASICALPTVVPSSEDEVWIEWRLGGDADRLGHRADLVLDVDAHALVDAHLDVGERDGLEARHLRRDGVVPGGKRRRRVFAVAVGREDAGQAGPLVDDGDLGTCDGGPGRVRDGAENRAADRLRNRRWRQPEGHGPEQHADAKCPGDRRTCVPDHLSSSSLTAECRRETCSREKPVRPKAEERRDWWTTRLVKHCPERDCERHISYAAAGWQ